MTKTELEGLSHTIALEVADRCHAPRKPGQAPHRYGIIYQAAQSGAIAAIKALQQREAKLAEALRSIRDDTSCQIAQFHAEQALAETGR